MATTKTTKSRVKKAAKSAATKRSTAKRTVKKAAKKVSKAPAVKRAKKAATRPATRKASATKGARRPTRGAATDAIALLKQDHREVEQLFKRFEKASDGAHKEKGRLVASMIEALSRHAAIEEMVFYPAVRRAVPREETAVLEALEEHHVVKWLLSELEGLDPAAERFDAKTTVLIESVRHHVKEEESDLFPKVRAKIARRELLELGDELRAAKRRAPTHPHPRSADTPPGNLIVGGAVAVMDRARDVGKRTVDRVREEIPAL
jgi:hemerythrin-like domain-containing protein